ncbi:nuclear transport factor 2 family protein [Ilumatobacter sp.]|uniref:nuclear transport factor 2 family protein n=1 Tax=Ilumatobacter sp. TaxID=1967498 RepID=UPI003751336C
MSNLSNPTPTIDQLLAIEACREAARRYSYGVDRLDVEVMKSAYWPNATDDHGVFVGNAWEFCDRVVGSHGRWAWTAHAITNHRVEFDNDTNARGEMYVEATLFDAAKDQLSTFHGRYLDNYERRDGEWRISHRVCVYHGDHVQLVRDSMGLDVSVFRQNSFDRPAHQRPIGP